MTSALTLVSDPPVSSRFARRPPRGLFWPLVVGVILLTGLAVPLLPLADPAAQSLSDALASPSTDHLLGTDELGRDLLSRLAFGARTTFLSAIVCVSVCTAIGLPLGLVAGSERGWFDQVTSRIADGIMAVPPLVLLLTVIAAIGPGLTRSMIILGVILAPRLFRVVRAETVVLSDSPFFEVARMSGCSRIRILSRYLLANLREQTVVQVTLLLGYAVLTEAGISFLGFGVQPPDPSLGVLLKSSMEYLETTPLLSLAPGLLMTMFIIACNLAGDRGSRGVA